MTGLSSLIEPVYNYREIIRAVRKGIWTLNHSIRGNDMGAGGIIQHHAKVLLIAVTDHSVYHCLSPESKTTVNMIDAKDPMSRTQADVNALYDILGVCKVP